MIGYPALWLLFYWDKDKVRPAYSLILWLGVSVGFATFFNSFCHKFIPLFLYILLRFLNALVLSLPVAVIYIVVIKLALFLWQRIGEMGREVIQQKIKLFILGYYGFGNWGDELSLRAVLGDLERIREELNPPFLSGFVPRERFFTSLPENAFPLERDSFFLFFKQSK